MLRARELSLKKNQRQLLNDVGFELASGELMAVIGPNGAGKSSLLRCLAGLWKPEGTLELGEQAIADMSLDNRAASLAWLGQQNMLAFDYTVRQVVALGPQHGHDAAINAAMQIFEVDAYAHRPLLQLSGGQQQRVHLARVFAQLNASSAQQQCLLLDEPLTALDLRWQQRCLRAVKNWLQQREGRYAILALHDIGLAMSHAQQVLLLQEGVIKSIGAPSLIGEPLLEQVWRYPLAIKQIDAQTLVYPKS